MMPTQTRVRPAITNTWPKVTPKMLLMLPRVIQQEGGSFLDRLSADPAVVRHLETEKLRELFDPAYYLRNLDRIFERTLADVWEEGA